MHTKKEETLFLRSCVAQNAQIFWRIQICKKNVTIIFSPLPTLPWPGSSCVTRHSLLGGARGEGAMSTMDPIVMLLVRSHWFGLSVDQAVNNARIEHSHGGVPRKTLDSSYSWKPMDKLWQA